MSLYRRLPVALAGLALMPGAAHALPLMDMEVGARYWQADPSGEVAYQGDNLDVADDLDFGKEWAPNLYARAALPIITIDAEYTDLSYDGKVQQSLSTEQWGGQTVTANGSSSFDATLLHGGFMFNVPLPVVDVGLGLGATQVDANAELEVNDGTGGTRKEEGSANFTMPVVKAEVRADLPVIPLNLVVRGSGIGYQGDNFRDITAAVGYQISLLEIRAGYRQIGIDYEGDDFTLDSDFSGPFAGLHVAF